MAFPLYQNYPGYNQMYYQPNVQQTNTIQNGGFVLVKNITEAMNYPVAPGHSVTFKNENQPYIYTKTLGFSQLDQPIFETFKLIKEDNSLNENFNGGIESANNQIEYLSLDEAEQIKQQLSDIRAEIDFLREYVETDAKEEKDEK